MKIVVDAEDVKLRVLYITREKFGQKLRELEFLCLFQELKFLTYAFNVTISPVLKRVPRKLCL